MLVALSIYYTEISAVCNNNKILIFITFVCDRQESSAEDVVFSSSLGASAAAVVCSSVAV